MSNSSEEDWSASDQTKTTGDIFCGMQVLIELIIMT